MCQPQSFLGQHEVISDGSFRSDIISRSPNHTLIRKQWKIYSWMETLFSITIKIFVLKTYLSKGQIISKLFLVSFISSKRRMKTSYHSSKKTTFVCFLEEFEDTKNYFKINWLLQMLKTYKLFRIKCTLVQL